MEQTKERSKWAGRLEVVLVMAAGEVFFIAAHYISIQPYYIWRFLLLAVLPLAVIPSHPFAYMGFTRKKIGKQLLFGLLTAVILYLVFAIPSQLILFQLYRPEGYRLILEPRFPHMTSGEIVKQAVLLIISSAPEEILYRGYFQNRLSFFTSSKPARVVIQAVLFGMVHFLNYWPDIFTPLAFIQVGSTAVFGFVVGWFYLYKRDKGYTILSAMTTHVVYNWLLQIAVGSSMVPA